jgi:anthranilate synthase component I
VTTLEMTVERRTLPTIHPLAAYRALRDRYGSDRTFLLESLSGPAADSKQSLAGLAGRAEIVVRRGQVEVLGEEHLVEAIRAILLDRGIVEEGTLRLVSDDALWDLPRAVEGAVVCDDDGTDLALAFLSVFGYDAARYVEVLPRTIPDLPDAPPDATFALVDALVSFDGSGAQLAVVSTAWTGEPVDEVASVISGVVGPVDETTAPDVPEPADIRDDMTYDEYVERGAVCLEHIRVGDIYQVQLGHSITVTTDADVLTVYERLRVRNPSPYMAILASAGHTVVCASPEVFVRVEGRRAVTRPIAGTAQRQGDLEAVAAALLADPKERAEHLMLVDLARNDLGRVADPGTLAVEALMVIEHYSHVMHIVSQVACQLAPGRDGYDLIRAGFPAGTMSGAPKVRAMEIIENLETSRRGFYAGAFGLIGMGGRDVVLGLAIRMAVHRDGQFVLRASAGFVADSTPDGEWNETLNKLASTYWAVCGKELR